jgi:hypothetical protein
MSDHKSIILQHYRISPEAERAGLVEEHAARGWRAPAEFVYEHMLSVAEIQVTNTFGMDGQSGIATLHDGTQIPWSQIYQRGYDRRKVSCINDDTGERWA